jgi:hypothetical protein
MDKYDRTMFLMIKQMKESLILPSLIGNYHPIHPKRKSRGEFVRRIGLLTNVGVNKFKNKPKVIQLKVT